MKEIGLISVASEYLQHEFLPGFRDAIDLNTDSVSADIRSGLHPVLDAFDLHGLTPKLSRAAGVGLNELLAANANQRMWLVVPQDGIH